MLVISTPKTLATIESSALKKSNIAFSVKDLTRSVSALVWSSDDASLFVAGGGLLRRYTLNDWTEKPIYSYEGEVPAFLVKDDKTAIFIHDNRVRLLDLDSGRVVKTVDSFESQEPKLLALSSNSNILAVATKSSCHIYDFSNSLSCSVLQGMADYGQRITSLVFHPHSPTKLLLGVGKKLLVYDTSKPSAPLKSISSISIKGDLISISCSPFSKTLIAVACSDETVRLMDLEKEKGLVKTVDMKCPLSLLSFSQDGSALLVGTDDGRLLVQDLRTLDKEPKSTQISETNEPILALSVQKKSSPTPLNTAKSTPVMMPLKSALKTGASTAKPLSQKDLNTQTPRRTSSAAAKKPDSSHGPTPARAKLSQQTTETKSPVQTRTSLGGGSTTPAKIRKPTPGTPASKLPAPGTPRIKSRAESTTTPSKSAPFPTTTKSSRDAQVSASKPRNGITSMKKTPDFKSVSRVSRSKLESQRTPSRVQVAKLTDQPTVPPLPFQPKKSKPDHDDDIDMDRPLSPLSKRLQERAMSRASQRTLSRAASTRIDSGASTPELPELPKEPVTPFVTRGFGASKKGLGGLSGMGVLGLSTPEVVKWAARDDSDDDAATEKGQPIRATQTNATFVAGGGSIWEEVLRRENGHLESSGTSSSSSENCTEIQLSPVRRGPTTGTGSGAIDPATPGRRTIMTSEMARELLRAMIHDAVSEFRAEAREEFLGIHLDMVKMGRAWKMELKDLMNEHVGDLDKALKENEALAKENKQLKDEIMGLKSATLP